MMKIVSFGTIECRQSDVTSTRVIVLDDKCFTEGKATIFLSFFLYSSGHIYENPKAKFQTFFFGKSFDSFKSFLMG